jgi:hypothetical protein
VPDNLFKAYKSVPDREFVRYIKEKEDSYDDGMDTTAETLMLRAANKYKRILESKEWKNLTPAYEKVIALEAAIKKLTSKQSKTNPNSDTIVGKTRKKKNNPSDGTSTAKKSKSEWMTKAPPTGSKRTKTVDGK